MMCERKFRGMKAGPQRRLRVDPWQDPHPAPSTLRLLKKDAPSIQGKTMMLADPFQRGARPPNRKSCWFFGQTKTAHGAARTLWLTGNANERAEIHER